MSISTRKRRPTQKEVALRAGVSQAVVSQVLNNRDGAIRIHPETRARVLGVMRDLGYVPNLAARSLAGGQNRILGVFTYEPVFPTDTRDFYYPFLEGIEHAAATLDYDLLLHTRAGGGEGRRAVYQNGATRLHLADGTLLLGYLDAERREELGRLLGEGYPAVFIGRREVPGHALAYVAADYAAATARATAALLARGHTRILYLGATLELESAADRERGYVRAMHEADLPASVSRLDAADVTPADVAARRRSGFTAVLLENDTLANSWTQGAAQVGLSAPRDFSFALLGDPISGHALPPGWATFTIPRWQMGFEAVRLLARLLGGEAVEPLILPCAWVPGDSIGDAPRAR